MNVGSQLVLCVVHKRRRAPHDLVDLGNGTWRCAPGSECREVELEICSVHQRRRAKYDLVETSPGIYQCTAAKPCHDRFDRRDGGVPGAGFGRGGFDSDRGGGMFRGGRGRGRGFGGDYAPTTFAAAAGSALTGAGMMPGAGFASSAVNVAAFDASSSGNAVTSSSAAAGSGTGLDATLGSSEQIMARFVATQQLQQHYMLAAAAAASGSVYGRAGAGPGAMSAASYYAAQMAALVGSVEVWCSRHGRRLQLRATRSVDGGMTFACLDPTECLAAPLEEPRVLAQRGCEDLWCAKHKRMRAASWLVVEPGKGFVCKKPHLCRHDDNDRGAAGVELEE